MSTLNCYCDIHQQFLYEEGRRTRKDEKKHQQMWSKRKSSVLLRHISPLSFQLNYFFLYGFLDAVTDELMEIASNIYVLGSTREMGVINMSLKQKRIWLLSKIHLTKRSVFSLRRSFHLLYIYHIHPCRLTSLIVHHVHTSLSVFPFFSSTHSGHEFFHIFSQPPSCVPEAHDMFAFASHMKNEFVD